MRDKTGRIKGKRKLEIYAEYAVTENKKGKKRKDRVNEWKIENEKNIDMDNYRYEKEKDRDKRGNGRWTCKDTNI